MRRFQYFILKALALVALTFSHRPRALARFDQMLVLCPLDRYALASRAHLLAQTNQFDEAIATQQQLSGLEGPPWQMAAVWFNLGYLLQQAGCHEEARPAFEKATEYDPGMDRAWYGLALVLIQQQQFQKARQALKRNTALQPMSPYGWCRLAEVHLALGEPEKTRKVIAHLRRFEPKVAAQLEREIGMGKLFDFLPVARCKPLNTAAGSETIDANY